MLDAPIPANDRARLQELRSYGILDSGDELEFDDIGHLVRDIAQTPIGIISLVDENRQWFKSCIGLEERETPRNISFCGHTILQRTPLIIEDALLDQRFRDNPLVVESPHIRFYAGFPLISRNGMALGSLCAVDHQPRQPTAQQITALERLARLVVQLMELRRESRMLQNSQQARAQESLQRQQPQPTASAGELMVGKEQIISMVELMISLNNHACFALLRLELKELRRISSTLGERVADTLRQELQRRLSQVVPANASCGELSDHEWLVLLPFASSEEQIGNLAEQIIHQLQQPVAIAGQLLGSPVAIGIAMVRDNYASAESLLADAAMALRDAARRHGSHHRFIDLASRIQAQADLQLEAQLREGLHRGQLLTHFQPLVELSSGRVVGLEALARWRSNEGDVLMPSAFLPAAERANLLAELDLQMISQAIAGSHQLGINPDGASMLLSLNLSAAVLDSPGAMARLLAILERQPLPPRWQLQLELLEGALQQPAAELAEALQQLDRHGVRLAIDDFGTGYSSLSRLNGYPFHTLKVDMSFVKLLDAPHKPSNRMLAVIRAMADALGLHTIAEGVESEPQRRWLQQQGFHWAQGYLFAKPMDLQQTAVYIRANWANAQLI